MVATCALDSVLDGFRAGVWSGQFGRYISKHLVVTVLLLLSAVSMRAAEAPEIRPQWNKVTGLVKTTLSIQACVEPPMRRESPIHDRLFQSVRDLNADFSKLQPWFPYPKLAVAELDPPHDGRTSWDFSLLDPIFVDFMQATSSHPVEMDIGTIPQWMFRTGKPVPYPSDPDEIDWTYNQGAELRDPTAKEVADYFARVAGWYTKGGFKDEYGQWHQSNYHFTFDDWEVLNENDEAEHHLSPQQYTRIYDQVVLALRQLDSQMKFIGLALSGPTRHPEYFEYFLNHSNHKPGIPLDWISYHFYARPELDESPEVMQHTFFTQADDFVSTVRYIEAIRKQLSPETKTDIDEVGTMTADNLALHPDIPNSYWNLSASEFAYLYIRLAQLGIDRIVGSELIDYPGQVPGNTLSDWNTGQPKPRYWVLKLLHDQIDPSDQMVEGEQLNPFANVPQVYASQAFVSAKGARKILLVNKRDRPLELRIPEGAGARVDYVDVTTGSNPPATRTLADDKLTLDGFGVAIIHLVH
jgi:hypothetical protein